MMDDTEYRAMRDRLARARLYLLAPRESKPAPASILARLAARARGAVRAYSKRIGSWISHT